MAEAIKFSSGLLSMVAARVPPYIRRAPMTEEIECPFCGEPGEIAADYDPDAVGDQVFVQDCGVCCRPWTVTVHVGADGDVSFDVQRS
jgi:hypothetical protein